MAKQPSETDKVYLDNLLDEVLEDYQKPVPPKSVKPNSESQKTDNDTASEWTEELIQQATKNFEKTMRNLLQNHQEAAKPVDDASNITPADASNQFNSAMSEFMKLAEASAKASVEDSNEKDIKKNLANAMEEITKNTDTANEAMTEEAVTGMFSKMGLNTEGSEEGIAGFFSVMENMVHNILSKDVIYPPLKDISSKFPDWLADNRQKLSDEDYDKFNKQYTLIQNIVDIFEREDENDSEETKNLNFQQVLQKFEELQSLGQPPEEISEGLGPNAPDVSSILSAFGLNPNNVEQGSNPAPADGCCLM